MYILVETSGSQVPLKGAVESPSYITKLLFYVFKWTLKARYSSRDLNV